MCLVKWTDLKSKMKQCKNSDATKSKSRRKNAVYFGVTQGEEAQLK